jgi:glycosyltransferase involved in cell wall biosynthesis
VHNGLDFERFKVTNALDSRDPNNILMSYHQHIQWKGSADGIAAFELARKQEPGIKLTLFGTAPTPDDLPFGVAYHQNPPQDRLRDLYNQASIFISPSWTEGFSLPPAEALQCGAALVLTCIPGRSAYAWHECTALLSPVKNPEAMAANILRLVRDPDLRLRLARDGHNKIQEFTWERAGSSLEMILLNSL